MRHLIKPALAVALALAGTACTTTPTTGPSTPDGPIAVGGPRGSEGGSGATIDPAALRKFGDAVTAYEEGKKLNVVDYDSLAKKFDAAAEADDNLAEAHFNLGVIAERQGKSAEALARYQRAIDKKPSLTVAYENLAVMMENAGKREEAGEQYKKILERYPDDAGARARLGELVLEGGDKERALALSREALLRDPKSITAAKVQMKVYFEKNELAMARLVAARAMKLDDKDPEIYFTMARILEKEGELEAAIAQYKRTLQVREDYAPARQRIVEYALANQNFVLAEQQYRALLKSSPNDAALHFNLGLALRGQGKHDEALAEYAKAGQLNGEDPSPYFATGIIFQKYKEAPEKALELYEKFTRHPASNIPSDHPVFAYVQECRGMIDAKQQAAEMEKQAAEEAKKMEAQEKKDAAEKKKEDDRKALEEAAKAGAADPNAGVAGSAAAAPAAAKPAPAAEVAPAPTPAPAAPPPPRPAGAKDPNEPTEDPL